MKYHPNSKGFTLIELLVVISIIAMLISILLPALGSARDAARSMVCLSDQRQIGFAMFNYAADSNGYMPPARLHNNFEGVKYSDPPSDSYNTGYAWAALLGYKGYMPIQIEPGSHQNDNRYQPGWQSFMCSAAPNQLGEGNFDSPGYQANMISFGYNYFHIGGSLRVPSLSGESRRFYISARQDEVVDASRKLMMVDSIAAPVNSPFPESPYRGYSVVADNANHSSTSERGRPDPRHNGSANIVWMDGHGSAVRSPDPADIRAIYTVLGNGSDASEPDVWSRSRSGKSVN